ncbi:MAG: allophanate hydrolase [Cereibacter sphaeroides]|uniref:Allophanate hydrolase n=1 Tax=Cereibacter sphaeroides TaxID=1063 RepID=A0A2W5SAA9_CERSP|nr:MAG: allophanate hydrolase [Cereibacter sphaeroides]
MTAPRFLDAGECALVVEFGDRIDDAIAEKVLALDAALTLTTPPGIVELVPTYRSLMIHYDPLITTRATLVDAVTDALRSTTSAAAKPRLWHLPACYDASLGEDLEHVAATTGLSVAEVIRLHACARYRVVMYGFAPGWAYLSGLPPELKLPRRTSPRDRIPEGSLIIAGGQAIVAGGAMPSGWHILGRTPERLFSPGRDPTFLVAVGDILTFEPVSLSTFDQLQRSVAAGEVVSQSEPAL